MATNLFWSIFACSLALALLLSCDKESSSSLNISGGEKVLPGEHMSSFVVGVNRTCTGVVVSDSHVITAAHCVSPGLASVYFNMNSDASTERLIAVASIHPDYDRAIGLDHDIALLTLLEPSWVRSKIRTDIFGRDYLPVDGVIAGYGQVKASGDLDQEEIGLRKADVLIAPSFGIRNGKIRYLPVSSSNHCEGDSGGPMLVSKEPYGESDFEACAEYPSGSSVSERKYGLVGIASHYVSDQKKCTGGGYYTDVRYYLPFIKQTINRSYSCLYDMESVQMGDLISVPDSCRSLTEKPSTVSIEHRHSAIESQDPDCMYPPEWEITTWIDLSASSKRLCL